MNRYTVLNGESTDLDQLTAVEMAFLRDVRQAYESKEPYPQFFNRVHEPRSPALRGGEWV